MMPSKCSVIAALTLLAPLIDFAVANAARADYPCCFPGTGMCQDLEYDACDRRGGRIVLSCEFCEQEARHNSPCCLEESRRCIDATEEGCQALGGRRPFGGIFGGGCDSCGFSSDHPITDPVDGGGGGDNGPTPLGGGSTDDDPPSGLESLLGLCGNGGATGFAVSIGSMVVLSSRVRRRTRK